MDAINKICVFEIPGREKMCTALTKKDCDGCAFFKTRAQAEMDIERSKKILKNKGLEPYQRGTIMTTRPIREKQNQFLFDKYEAIEEASEK